MSARTRGALLVTIALAAVSLGGCGSDPASDTAQEARVEQTLAEAFAGADDLTAIGTAVDEAGLAGVFDGPGSYTVLAPTDAAFEALGAKGEALTATDDNAVLAAILRDHIVPGHIEPTAIREAIEKKGAPVEMGTLGEGTVTFSLDGEQIAVAGPDGEAAGRLTGEPLIARNGVILPVDALLKPAPPAAVAATGQ